MFLRVPISKGSPGNKVSKPAPRPETLSENVSADQTATFASPRSAYTFRNVRISAPGEDTTAGQTPSAPKRLPGAMQAKLKLGALDDRLEHEADRVAEQVMCMPKAAQKPEDAQSKLTAGDFPEQTSTPSAAPQVVHEVLGSPGQPLDGAAREFFEPRFGHDFSRIRVHTDARAAESARAVGARAYTVGRQIVFGSGQYGSTAGEHARLMAHELAHVVQQGASPSAKVLRRQPQQSTVQVGKDVKQLPQGAGGSGAIIYEYTARAMREPADKSDREKPGKQFEIDLPLLVYTPANIDTTKTPPKVNIFVFFHGMRATYEEGTKTQAAPGEEPIALWTHLKEAVAGTDRVGIAPQAPRTWAFSNRSKSWIRSTAQWYEALGKVGFDGLINTALEKLSKDLGLKTALVAGDIHVAGHSAGGQGIIRATSHAAGASAFSDAVQDVTLQDAGYYFEHWENLMDWLLDGSPGRLYGCWSPTLKEALRRVRAIRDRSSPIFSMSRRSTTASRRRKRAMTLRQWGLPCRNRKTRRPGPAASFWNRKQWSTTRKPLESPKERL